MGVIPETMKTELEREKIVREHESAGGLDVTKPPEIIDAVVAHRHVPYGNCYGLLLQVHSLQD